MPPSTASGSALSSTLDSAELLADFQPHSVGGAGTDSEGGNSIDGRDDETTEQKAEREKTRRQANNARER